MTQVHHYMVDFEDETGTVRFAGNEMSSLDAAKLLAQATSLAVQSGSAAAVAYADKGDGTYESVGAVCYYQGKVSDEDGTLQ